MIQHIASANMLNIAGDERRPNGNLVSMKILFNQHIPSKIHYAGSTGKSLNACFTSILLIRQLVPALLTIDVASSKCVYLTEKSSLSIPSFIDWPLGWDRSMMSQREPSFFSRDLRGEQCKLGMGGVENGPDVWPLSISFMMTWVTGKVCSVAERRLFGTVALCGVRVRW